MVCFAFFCSFSQVCLGTLYKIVGQSYKSLVVKSKKNLGKTTKNCKADHLSRPSPTLRLHLGAVQLLLIYPSIFAFLLATLVPIFFNGIERVLYENCSKCLLNKPFQSLNSFLKFCIEELFKRFSFVFKWKTHILCIDFTAFSLKVGVPIKENSLRAISVF